MKLQDYLLEIVNALGIKVGALIAGVAGALVSMAYESDLKPRRALVLIAVGTIAAGYVTPLFAHLLGFGPELTNAISFLVGLIGMKLFGLVLNILDAVRKDPSVLWVWVSMIVKKR